MTSDPVCIELKSEGDAVRDDDTNENVLYEDHGIRIVELLDEKYTKDAFEYTSVVRVENNTENEIVVMTDYPEECSVYLYAQVPAGKASVVDAILRNSYYVEEENSAPETEVLDTPEKTVEISFTISGVDEPIHVDAAALTMRSHGVASLENQ